MQQITQLKSSLKNKALRRLILKRNFWKYPNKYQGKNGKTLGKNT